MTGVRVLIQTPEKKTRCQNGSFQVNRRGARDKEAFKLDKKWAACCAAERNRKYGKNEPLQTLQTLLTRRFVGSLYVSPQKYEAIILTSAKEMTSQPTNEL